MNNTSVDKYKFYLMQQLVDEHHISELEAQKCNDIDRVSYCFGKQLAAITAWRDDEWHETLSKLGFFLGKYIYILDAYDDLEKDVEKKNYNMLIPYMKQPDFDNYVIKLIVSGNGSKLSTEIPILENVENREYYGRTATEIKNVVDIRYDKQQPLIAFVYDNDEMSVPTLDDFINSQTDFLSKNDYVYYVAFEFCK